jgi:hypothetical protein
VTAVGFPVGEELKGVGDGAVGLGVVGEEVIAFAVERPRRLAINEILLRPANQPYHRRATASLRCPNGVA